eukprot:3343664-Pyramimonas_sp.AAC.1
MVISCATRHDGYAKQEAEVKYLIMYWQDWSPAEGNIPTSVFGALPFREPSTNVDFYSRFKRNWRWCNTFILLNGFQEFP